MTTMNISLPEVLKAFVDEQVRERGYGTSSEYVRELLRRERDRLELRRVLMDGAASPPGDPVDSGYYGELRTRVRRVAESTPER
jgi:antitoxin ParD1/3/4